jgi:EAL domain-containing protein (putative c-di-GMP-specific phosphodiesterase class I)
VLIETLPIDILKFDRGFMAVLEHDLAAEAAFFSIVSLAKSWQIQLSAEGIENPDQIEFLSWHGFRILQGYWYSTPISARELQAWLSAHHRWVAC